MQWIAFPAWKLKVEFAIFYGIEITLGCVKLLHLKMEKFYLKVLDRLKSQEAIFLLDTTRWYLYLKKFEILTNPLFLPWLVHVSRLVFLKYQNEKRTLKTIFLFMSVAVLTIALNLI